MLGSFQRETPEANTENRWAAFEAEALPHLESLFRFAMWRARERAEAEDLVQETFAEGLKSFHRYEPGTNCRAWLISIMSHLVSRRRRKSSRLRLVGGGVERIAGTIAYEPPPPQDIRDEEVLGALRRIPPYYSQVVLLADVEDLSYREIAAALDVPVGTVMSRLARGRNLLRAELATYASDHGGARLKWRAINGADVRLKFRREMMR